MLTAVKKLREIGFTTESKKIVKNYLDSRCLSPFEGLGYISYFRDDSITISNSLIFFIQIGNKKDVGVELKSLTDNSYRKLYSGVHSHVYNLLNFRDVVLITEGIFDAESINQNIGDIAISTLRASVSNRVLHFICSLTGSKIFVAFDNDKSGIENSRKILKFVNSYYKDLSVKFLDYPYGDLNEFLIKVGRDRFNSMISNQLGI